MYKIMF